MSNHFGWYAIFWIEKNMKPIEKTTSAGMRFCFDVPFMPCVSLSQ